MLGGPVERRGTQVVFPDQCLPNNVGVAEGGVGILHDVLKGQGFVCANNKNS